MMVNKLKIWLFKPLKRDNFVLKVDIVDVTDVTSICRCFWHVTHISGLVVGTLALAVEELFNICNSTHIWPPIHEPKLDMLFADNELRWCQACECKGRFILTSCTWSLNQRSSKRIIFWCNTGVWQIYLHGCTTSWVHVWSIFQTWYSSLGKRSAFQFLYLITC